MQSGTVYALLQLGAPGIWGPASSGSTPKVFRGPKAKVEEKGLVVVFPLPSIASVLIPYGLKPQFCISTSLASGLFTVYAASGFQEAL